MPGSDELRGWKEIAAYLGKSVRAAQRWEQELGLPVRRIRTSAGHAIYARRAEIDAWRARQEALNGVSHLVDDEPETPPESVDGSLDAGGGAAAGEPPGLRTRWRNGRATAWIALALCFVVASAYGWRALPRDATPTLTYSFSKDSLVAVDSSGAEIWRYRFPYLIGGVGEAGGGATPDPSARIRHADVDGDGTDEILVMLRFTAPSYPSDALLCFATNGELRWSYQPNETLDFSGVSYSAPWLVTNWVVGGAGNDRAVYVTVNHSMWWPSMIVRITRRGEAQRLFTQSGGAYSLMWWAGGDRPYLLAAGINNEYGGAALALIDPAGGATTSPQTPGSGYVCSGCATNGPEGYFVFPKTDVTVAGELPYNRGAALGSSGSGVRLLVEEDLRHPEAIRVFELTEGLQLQSAAPTDLFWVRHDRLEREKHLDHSSALCPHRTQATAVRTWTPSGGWRSINVPTAAPKLAPEGSSNIP